MVTTDELETVDPQRWARAADAWEACAELWSTSSSEYQKRVLNKLEHWTGAAGWVAKQLAHRIKDDFDRTEDDVAGWMRDVARVLRAFSDDLSEAQAKLESASGLPEVDASAMVTSVRQAAIAEATELANTADHTAARRLRALLEGEGWVDAYDLSPTEAVDLMHKAANGDPRALAELKAHKRFFSDPYFAQAFLEELGPTGLTELPGTMAEHLRTLGDSGDTDDASRTAAGNGQLLGMLSDALAVGTDPTNPAWNEGELDSYLQSLKEAGREWHETPSDGRPYHGYWALGQVMAEAGDQPAYSTEFLSTIGNDMVAVDQDRTGSDPGWPASAGPYGPVADGLSAPAGGGTDPLSGLLHAAATNSEGAQAILANDDDASNLKYLLQDRQWSDHGDALGEAIEVGAHPDLGNPNDAALIAAETVHTLGRSLSEDLNGTSDRLDGMQDSVGRMLGSRISEVSEWANNDSDVHGLTDPNDPTKAQYNTKDLAETIRFAAGSDAGYKALLDAEIRFAGEMFAMEATTGDGDTPGAAKAAAQTLGFINEARESALELAAIERDEANAMLADYAKKGVGLLELPAGLTGLAAQEATNAMIDKLIRSDHLGEAQAAGATDEKQAQQVLQDIAGRVVVNNPQLLHEGAQTPQEWVEASDVTKDEDRDREVKRRTALLPKFYDTENQRLLPVEDLMKENAAGASAMRNYLTEGAGRAYSELEVDPHYWAGERELRTQLGLPPKTEEGDQD